MTTIKDIINYFEDFGANDYLLKVIDIYDKFATAKIIAKNKKASLSFAF